MKKKSFVVDRGDDPPDRCESIAHSVIDHLKMQESEDKGSPVSPTDNQIALPLFMLSHYVADAHMPFHCASRRFSQGNDLHAHIEGEWHDMTGRHCRIDEDNDRFFYDPYGYPLRDAGTDEEYQSSFLATVDGLLRERESIMPRGTTNKTVWDFMSATRQQSYLLPYCLIPQQYDHTDVTMENWQSSRSITFEDGGAGCSCNGEAFTRH